MSFYDNSTPAQKAVQGVDNRMTAALNYLLMTFQTSMKDVWEADGKPNGYTAQQFFDVLGTEAGDLVQRAQQTKAFLLQQKPDLVLPEPPAFTVNQDGTVTVTVPPAAQ